MRHSVHYWLLHAIGLGLPRALGIPHELAPASQWEHKWKELASRHPLDASEKMGLDGHGIDPQMVGHIEAQKDRDTATLTRFVAPTP